MPPPEPPGTMHVFPMQLQVGDKLSDETGQWEVVGRPHTTGGGKKTDARVQRADQPGLTETRTWGSYEKVTVIRRDCRGRQAMMLTDRLGSQQKPPEVDG